MQKTVKRTVTLCGGCLMILIVLKPLLGSNFTLDPQRLILAEAGKDSAASDPDEVYRQIMQELITDQTLELLRNKAEELGFSAEFTVKLARDETSGQYVPWEVETSGALSQEQRSALSKFLSESLNVPTERQRWRFS